MANRAGTTLTALFSLVIGGVIGAGAGLLLAPRVPRAPRAGRKTRKKIKKPTADILGQAAGYTEKI